jgi:hypothetical protein
MRLNGRVRNGNGCDPHGKGTDKNPPGRFRPGGLFDRETCCGVMDVLENSRTPFRIQIAFIVWRAFARHSIKGVKSLTVSTGNLRTSRFVQLQPINRVVYPGSLVPEGTGNPRLGIGFTLRCFQRLSVPDIATQPCR